MSSTIWPRKSDGGNYIYRGERRPYPKVSSSLYRQYADIEAADFDIEVVQREILAQAREYTKYTGEMEDLEILSQLQHNGGATNLIDFTTDFLIALFFACDGAPEESGRVVLLSENGDDYHLEAPSYPAHRVIAPKSVFVRPDKGFVEPDDEVIVDGSHKPAILDYLRERHGIATETIYNDLHGFIRHQGIHQSAYVEFYKGFTSATKGNYQQAISHYSNAITLNPQLTSAYNNRGVAYYDVGNYRSAIADYEIALEQNPEAHTVYNNLGLTYIRQGIYSRAVDCYNRSLELRDDARIYCNRGEALLHLSQWDDARYDLSSARNGGVDIIASFRGDYESVADFERQTGITMPDDIAEMLGG